MCFVFRNSLAEYGKHLHSGGAAHFEGKQLDFKSIQTLSLLSQYLSRGLDT